MARLAVGQRAAFQPSEVHSGERLFAPGRAILSGQPSEYVPISDGSLLSSGA